MGERGTDMTGVDSFEDRLLGVLTAIDAQRPIARPAPRRLTVSVASESPLRTARPRARRRLALLVVSVAMLLTGGATVAAASGLFPIAPTWVKEIFAGLDGASGHDVDAARAVEVGVVDEHAVYAAPTADGGFCLNFADHPRSGPTGSSCIARGAGPGEVVFSVLMGSDGGFVFGRSGQPDASTVAITFPGTGTVEASIAESGFFMAAIPDWAMNTLMIESTDPKDPPSKDGGPIRIFDPSRVYRLVVTATDTHGNPVAHGVPTELTEPN